MVLFSRYRSSGPILVVLTPSNMSDIRIKLHNRCTQTKHNTCTSCLRAGWRAGLTVLCMLVPTLLSHAHHGAHRSAGTLAGKHPCGNRLADLALALQTQQWRLLTSGPEHHGSRAIDGHIPRSGGFSRHTKTMQGFSPDLKYAHLTTDKTYTA
jgi:hypothetical protein